MTTKWHPSTNGSRPRNPREDDSATIAWQFAGLAYSFLLFGGIAVLHLARAALAGIATAGGRVISSLLSFLGSSLNTKG